METMNKLSEDKPNLHITKVKVQNMTGNTGREIPNQFEIRTKEGIYFQSYTSLIAYIDFATDKVYLDANTWDYSRTTGKYRNIFLNEDKAETEKKIKSGEYELTNLNPGVF